MPIAVKCKSCGCAFRVKDEAAGKAVRCKDCQEPIRVPVAGNSSSTTRPAKAAKPKPADEDQDVDWTKLAKMASNAESATQPCPKCGEDIGLKDAVCEFCGHNLKKGAKKKSSRGSSSGSGTPIWAIFAGLLVCGYVIGFVAALLVGDNLKLVAFAVTAGSAGLLQFWGWIWFLKVAFEDNVSTGFLCLFIPFYALYFWSQHPDDANLPGGLTVVGGILGGLANGLLPVLVAS